jgi:hypothetical protein
MMTTDKTTLFAVAFAVCCAVLYAICTELNLPLVTYHPVIGEIDLGRTPPRSGPAMYWYGWMLTAGVAAAALAALATLVPERWLQRAILVAALAAVVYSVAYTVALLVYENATVELEFLKWRSLSLAAAVTVALLAGVFVPASWRERLWPGWAWLVPIGALSVLCYYLTPYFTR